MTVSKKIRAPLFFRSCQAQAGAPQTSFFFVSRLPIRVCSGELRGRLETGGGRQCFLSACCSTRGVLPMGGGAFRSAGGGLSVPFCAPVPVSWCSLRRQRLWPQRTSSELGRSPLLSSKSRSKNTFLCFYSWWWGVVATYRLTWATSVFFCSLCPPEPRETVPRVSSS